MGLILALVGSFLWIKRHHLRFPHALILVPLGLGVIWVSNAARITALVLLGTWGFGGVALGAFHSQAGWLAFDAVGLGLIAVAGRWSFVRAGAPHREAVEESSPSAPYLIPFLSLIAASMITGAFSNGFDRLYPLRVLVAGGVLWHYRRRYSGLRWGFSWGSVAIGVAAFGLWMSLESIAPTRMVAQRVDPLTSLAGLSRGGLMAWLTFRVIGSVVIVPVVEELAFRAYLTRRLIAREFWSLPLGAFAWSSFLISSALFGLLHGRWLAGTLAGMLYALALYRRRVLSDAVLAHATTNALIAAWVLATGDWALWD